MKTMIDSLRYITPGRGLRLEYVRQRVAELETLRENELGEVGKLLCHESSAEMREAYPIIGEHRITKEQGFSVDVFGDPDSRKRPATYVGLPSEREFAI